MGGAVVSRVEGEAFFELPGELMDVTVAGEISGVGNGSGRSASSGDLLILPRRFA